jgi:hypothetical protein
VIVLAIPRPSAADWRPLHAAEIAQLSDGLWDALTQAGAVPKLQPRAHPAAFVAAIWRGARPIMAVGDTVWWPDAAESFADTIHMSVLQHELQHVLDYAEGRLSVLGYLLNPRNWFYRYDLSRVETWQALGAEQRASLAEHLWRFERSGDLLQVQRIRALIPWGGPP